jgi:hypothetical protein
MKKEELLEQIAYEIWIKRENIKSMVEITDIINKHLVLSDVHISKDAEEMLSRIIKTPIFTDYKWDIWLFIEGIFEKKKDEIEKILFLCKEIDDFEDMTDKYTFHHNHNFSTWIASIEDVKQKYKLYFNSFIKMKEKLVAINNDFKKFRDDVIDANLYVSAKRVYNNYRKELKEKDYEITFPDWLEKTYWKEIQ